MSTEREELERLRTALSAFGMERADELLASARDEALERARSILVTEMTRALLDGAGARLGSGQRARDGRRRSPSPAPSPPPADASDTALYVYGVGSSEAEELDGAVREGLGVASAPPFTLREGELAAIASTVPLAEFDEGRLRENLNDVEWLERVARAHEEVLERALRAATVVPLRLCTMYRDAQHVRAMLAREEPVFREALARLRGKTEWGVKMIAEPGALERALNGAEHERLEDVPTGVAYLRERGRQARAREDLDELAARLAADVHDELAARAEEALLNPLQNPEVSGHEGDMLLNGAYLVADAELPAFRQQCERLTGAFAPRGVVVELTGPWPPYNFVRSTLETSA